MKTKSSKIPKVKIQTLFQYLGRPAGPKLGREVEEIARLNHQVVYKRHVKNVNYNGLVNAYNSKFLEGYFKNVKKVDQEETEKPSFVKKPNVVLSLSGGMDSGTLLLRCLAKYENVVCLSFDYGQKHKIELERASQLVEYINGNPYNSIFTDEGYSSLYKNVKHKIIDISSVSSLLSSSLVDGGDEVPEGHYQEDSMKETVVPNRNKIFSSIVQAVALSIAQDTGKPCDIALGIHAGDHDIYPDCRQEFRDADSLAFLLGNWEADKVNSYTPYIKGNKTTILKDGIKLCDYLNLNFDEVYKRTNTSYKPYPSGNSDYKSSSSVERIQSFIEIGVNDPVQYEDETGVVSYEVAKHHVEKILEQNKTL
jgi:7-cyano-7-deazaguanine synthase